MDSIEKQNFTDKIITRQFEMKYFYFEKLHNKFIDSHIIIYLRWQKFA